MANIGYKAECMVEDVNDANSYIQAKLREVYFTKLCLDTNAFNRVNVFTVAFVILFGLVLLSLPLQMRKVFIQRP